MRRRQLFEIEDMPWCPSAVRDGATDWLAFVANATGVFRPAAPTIRAAMEATGTSRVVDLCSGGGGPWPTLAQELAQTGPLEVVLSDLHPNHGALARLRARSRGRLAVHPVPVDATRVPATLEGVRTLFNAFHHFPPDRARAILADAVRQRRAIAIVEPVDHRGFGLLGLPLLLPAILLATPFVRPFRWSRLLLTYLLPIVPAIVLFDGVMSVLRIYQRDELRELVAQVPRHDSFHWDIGSIPIRGLPMGLLYLVGVPREGSDPDQPSHPGPTP